MTFTYHERIEEIEHLADQLDALLAFKHAAHRNNHQEASQLSHWAECYKDGLHYGVLATDDNTEHETARLIGLSDRLKLEEQGLNGMEPLADEEVELPQETEEFISSARKLINDAVLPPKATDKLYEYNASPSIIKEKTMLQTRVRDLMKRNPVIIPLDYTLQEAAQEMEVINCGALPVGTADKVEGMITDRDIVLRAVAKGKDSSKEKVKDFMTTDICAISEDDATYRAADMMRERNVNRLLVNDSDGKPRGVLTFGRILRENASLQELAVVIECAVGGKVT